MQFLDQIKEEISLEVNSSSVTPFSYLIEIKELKIHYVRLEHYSADSFKTANKILKSNYSNVITIFEDVYKTQSIKVIARLKYLLEKSKRIHGRSTQVKKITKPQAFDFLEQNHLNTALKTKANYGLFYKNELVAVASFGQVIKMRNGSRSSELIRFCNKLGYRVVGGLSKLIQQYQKDMDLNELMTYADMDWGDGISYKKLGFKEVEIKNPVRFVVHLPTMIRVHALKFQKENDPVLLKFNEYRTVENCGSIKYIKYF